MAHPFLLPAALRTGDRVRLIAPAGVFDRTLFWRGVQWLRSHFRVQFSRELFARTPPTAGSSELRLREINAAFRCPETRAIWCVRGGYGCSEIASGADFDAFARSPKWLAGFSDITVLHSELSRRRIASLHAPNVTGLGLGWDPLRTATLQALFAPTTSQTFESLEQFYPGGATGPLVGGNLTLIHEAAATGRLIFPEGAIVFLEEVNEAPYRVARALLALERMGAFDRIAGVVLGQFSTACPGIDARFRETLKQFALRIRVPVLAGLPSGHYPRENRVLTIGALARLGRGNLVLNVRS
jgi:muramoyltetrapeptide carboxypeptidase